MMSMKWMEKTPTVPVAIAPTISQRNQPLPTSVMEADVAVPDPMAVIEPLAPEPVRLKLQKKPSVEAPVSSHAN